VLGKIAAAHEKGIQLVVTEDTALHDVRVDARDLITLGGQSRRQPDGCRAGRPLPRRVIATVRNDADTILVRVAYSGAKLRPDAVRDAFSGGWSTKSAEHEDGRGLGLALVGPASHRYHGSIEVCQDDGAVFTVRLPQPTSVH
jgi:two-component system, CitB family, sensor kinase